MKKIILMVPIFLCVTILGSYDLTIVGARINFANGLERIPITVANLLQHDVTINFTRQEVLTFKDMPGSVEKLIKEHTNDEAGKVSILFDPLWYPGKDFYKNVPNSAIKIAYSMLESSAIPSEWVEILNKHFDAVAVPDVWLKQVYEKCGVIKPIFVLPIGLYLKDFYEYSRAESKKDKPFIYYCSAACVPGKNHKLLCQAFVETFGGRDDVKLCIHSRGGGYSNDVKEYIKSLNVNNIELIQRVLSDKEYTELMTSADCYVLVSSGEGFSITPREAMALGIPTIISDNTTHKTLCKSGIPLCVSCPHEEAAFYHVFNRVVGEKFSPDLSNLKKCLKDVYDNYGYYFEKAQNSRSWVMRYEHTNLKNYFLNIIRPQTVVLSDKNEIYENYLEVNDELLYKKYAEIY